IWNPPYAAWTASTPGPRLRPSAWSRNARSTASMQSRRVRRSITSRRDRMRGVGREGLAPIPGLLRRRRVEPLEQREAIGQHLMVVGRCREEGTDRDVDAARFLVRVLAVSKGGPVARLGQSGEEAITQAGPLDQRLEGAVLSLMAQLHSRGVEGDGVLRELRRRREHEHRLGVDEALDQPRRGDAVDVRTRAGDP